MPHTRTLAHRSPLDLRDQFASHPVPVKSGAALQEVLLRVLDRAGTVAPEHAPMWEAFLTILEQNQSDPRSTARCAVLANLVALVAFDETSDYVATSHLVDHLGERRLARLQHRASIALDTSTSLPWASAAARRLLAPDLQARLAADPATTHEAAPLATTCASVARALVFEDLDTEQATAPITSVDALVDLLDTGTLPEWRIHLGMIAASPWGSYADLLVTLAKESGRPVLLASTESSVEQCREWCRDQERDQVAREIRHLVALSGTSQREFSSRIGTSPSRLSTYVRGTVTPSAAMLLRIQRASRTMQRQSTQPTHQAVALSH
ncbi:hypothetical protein ASE01_03980 [Nocardioides sp. Root190]|uniref:helix-turn-helix domain-containing protein n=1 Tax=Nocardioides sp. Root190 TaxID=1736488 RepID=UPI0006FEC070|nr:helix-turn-helix transcriptional regulator [Nocardioides sp. Root190]KRB78434.1 hypothetical protein ASE01_03980 [Nocardioides sp. Root190]